MSGLDSASTPLRAIERADPPAFELDVLVVTRSSRSKVGERHGERLKVHVTAPPVDGEANAAVIEVIAEAIGARRTDVTIVRGASSRRKTLRLNLLDHDPGAILRGLGLTLVALALGASACSTADELPIAVMLPEETSELARADNASLVLHPEGEVTSFAVDGLDFSLSWELEPDSKIRTLELYLAEEEELLGWGASAPFTLEGTDAGITIFLGPIGSLSTFPIASPSDPSLLAARAIGRGIVVVESGGETTLLNEYDLSFEYGSRHPDPHDPLDGALFSVSDGTVLHLTWGAGLEAWRYSPASDEWTTLILADPDQWGAREGASTLLGNCAFDDGDVEECVFLLGGGERSDVLAIARRPDDTGGLSVAVVDEVALDAPRRGATAAWVGREDDPTVSIVLFGGEDETLPLVLSSATGSLVGDAQAWTDAACTQLTPVSGDGTVEILCMGGTRAGLASADALRILVPAAGPPSVEHLDAFLPAPLPDPLLLEDSGALYAQGESLLFRIDRADLAVGESLPNSTRAGGGHSVPIASGATFVVGGSGQDGAAVDHWQVFTPDPRE